MSVKDITLWSEQEFGQKCGSILSTAKSLWGSVAEAAVQVILHYHRHKLDASRPQALYVTLQDAGLGSHLTAYQNLLRQTTQITGIGGDADWKGAGKKDMPEDWETIIDRLIDQGGTGLMAFKPVVAAGKGEKKAQAKVVKFGAQVPEATANALQKAIDAAKPEDLEKIVQTISKGPGAPEFKDPEVQEAFELFLAEAHELEMQEGTAEFHGKKETAKDKLLRGFSSARKVLQNFVSDFEAVKMAALADVEESEAPEKAEAA